MKSILKTLKIISWIWIGIVLLVSSTLTKAETSIIANIFGWGIPVLIMISPAVAFLIWRFNAEKESRNQIKISREINQQKKIKEEKINYQNNKLSEENIKKLMDLKELLNLEIITKEEFEKKKNDLLN